MSIIFYILIVIRFFLCKILGKTRIGDEKQSSENQFNRDIIATRILLRPADCVVRYRSDCTGRGTFSYYSALYGTLDFRYIGGDAGPVVVYGAA